MQEVEQLSGLIAEIYDAALDGSLWPDVLKKAAAFVGGPGAGVWSFDTSSENRGTARTWGFDAGYSRAYLDIYAKLDPAVGAYLCAQLGRPVVQSMFAPEKDSIETRFYREWARPQGLVDCIQIVIDRRGTERTLFGVSRGKRNGMVNDQTCRRMRLLAPHIRRALLVGRAMDDKHAEDAGFAEVVDALRAAVFLVDIDGRLVHVNSAGRVMLSECGPVRVCSGRLISGDPAVDRHLHDIFASAGQADAAVGGSGIALPLTVPDGERYVAHVLPLACGLRRRGAGRATVAALFVHKAAPAATSLPEWIARSYRLTPTELRVLLAIVEVGGAPDVAETLGIAASTVKTHLSRVYEKTGTKRHADLVKLVAAIANPLLH